MHVCDYASNDFWLKFLTNLIIIIIGGGIIIPATSFLRK